MGSVPMRICLHEQDNENLPSQNYKPFFILKAQYVATQAQLHTWSKIAGNRSQ